MRVYLIRNELRFYEADGWTEEPLLSCLEQGSLELFTMSFISRGSLDNASFYRLSLKDSPGSFNIERLSGLVSEIFDGNNSRLLPSERRKALRYNSQVGVFTWGERQ